MSGFLLRNGKLKIATRYALKMVSKAQGFVSSPGYQNHWKFQVILITNLIASANLAFGLAMFKALIQIQITFQIV